MAAKQLSQSLTHPNCEIPYVIGNKYNHLSDNSVLGLYRAKDSGTVYYYKDDIMIFHYENLDKLETRVIPPIIKTHGIYGSRLRYSLKEGDRFQAGDTIYEYDCFRNGIPSTGYNIFTCFIPSFGLI